MSYATYTLLTSVNSNMPKNKSQIKEEVAKIKAALLGKTFAKKAPTMQNKTSIILGSSHENISLFNDTLAPAKTLTIQFSQAEIDSFALKFVLSNKLRIKKTVAARKTVKVEKTLKITKAIPKKDISPVIGKFTQAIVNENPNKKDWYAHCNEEMKDEYRRRFHRTQDTPKKLKELKMNSIAMKQIKHPQKNNLGNFVKALKNMLKSPRGR